MRKITILILLVTVYSCQNEKIFTKEILAKNVLEALQKNDFELFKETVPNYEFAKKMADINISEYDNFITELYINCQGEFTKNNYKASDFELFKINEPYRTYELDSFEYLRYYVILKNKQSSYIKLNFSDCIKTPNGYKLGQPITIEK